MIGYVTVGTNNFEVPLKFYDTLVLSVGVKRFGSKSKWQLGGAQGIPKEAL